MALLARLPHPLSWACFANILQSLLLSHAPGFCPFLMLSAIRKENKGSFSVVGSSLSFKVGFFFFFFFEIPTSVLAIPFTTKT